MIAIAFTPIGTPGPSPSHEGGCGASGADAEFQRTRGLDANRAFIAGPPGEASGL